ncbi:asparagine synthase (glutamine-hydrolyzing) [Candidatus Woesebacteria bacterium RIFCSPHIGHO2_01_FULL_39_32]|uniref:asparagine synthase (glutamine-hydrolyzing) n=1 Tax=Candidatus Woesebacteria bacterium RIFCSPLOWO2_01_FULL_39_25 TaxID=1802521 RepID=A0A1F8BLS7_9BACT|nr:MAG: asparagine synthase (glutamine-hydrolyzing) [Candidatus Woesebacteria bacterium GWB1_37_5]OGM25389.1 MAG: asparagine synthase (glutamine-hydrolyzing) [Candidatus Woesebacteria bacterium RIFCSPHIGHO2_01_FULL_39_32]OGM38495.1 MAG: asparagine synthase (glutamine-hydrolyzing) [Candidatus Woesebacteria bacterium RIFCSPHIGHO2_12_FULL_38_11]OGM64920.1 MAG: asparagine synthase (glutamine-hydrolyzing) [Candidatus Woesebacteria bacterium RIFCSPLOWO2_01_FULL_39_25]
MCGIAGKIYFNSLILQEKELLAMAKKIVHRGPDDQGIYISQNKKVGLVNRRLAIIDLSAKGHQPMQFNNRYWITFNGEIYNFQSLKKRLQREGVKFKSNTDTEVILALYAKFGVKCLNHLRGMFAFAIYDEKQNSLFLARDRIGKKPLKYFIDGNTFIFASELKAIITQKEVKRTPDYEAIYHYLTFGYIHPPRTGFVGINKLEPGHYLILDLKKRNLVKRQYWEPDFSKKLYLSENEWKDMIVNELAEATKLRLISDVPLGAFLSGGVDSSAVVALMARYSKKPVRTFTIGFKDKVYDESEYAQRISKMYNTDHSEIFVEPENIEILPELVYQYEEPYADASSVVTYMVSKLARSEVTVALNGDGGDELFAGYDRYRRIARDVFLDHIEKIIRPVGIPLSSLLSGTHIASKFWLRSGKFLQKSMLPLADRFASYVEYFSETDKQKLALSYFTDNAGGQSSYEIVRNVFKDSGYIDPRDEALYWDLTKYLPEDLLVKVDIASMSVGLEARSPFIDHKVVELACQIPFDLKVRNFKVNKYILKKALEDLVPYDNLYRKKVGFSIPLDKWFTGKLNKYSESVLLDKNAKTRNLFNQKEIKRMLKSHTEKTDFGPKLWSLLTLELWFKNFFD